MAHALHALKCLLTFTGSLCAYKRTSNVLVSVSLPLKELIIYLEKEMGSKAFVLLGLLLAFVLLIASEVTARDLAETSTSEEISECRLLFQLFVCLKCI